MSLTLSLSRRLKLPALKCLKPVPIARHRPTITISQRRTLISSPPKALHPRSNSPSIFFGDIRSLDLSSTIPILQKHNLTHLDTAAVYAAGESEKRLGEANISTHGFTLDTKVLSSRPSDRTLSPQNIESSLETSLERLKVDKVHTLYAHGPDYATPIEEQAKAFDALHQRGLFSELGLANCMPDYIQQFLATSRVQNYIRPTWFQGQYNLVVRTYEKTLFPILRAKGMHFAAYSPLAGGFLNGNLTPEKASGSRFTGGHGASNTYRKNFDKPAMHVAYSKLRRVAEKTGIRTNELSLRWLVYHSLLQEGDAVILGASKIHHIEESCEQIERGPLDGEISHSLDTLWNDDLEVAAEPIVDFGPSKVR